MALFFNQRKTRGFNYLPRFYDPEAEAREDRKKIVLGEKYRSPAELAREAAREAGEDMGSGNVEYVPGAYLRQHVVARRGNATAADVIRKRRRKAKSIPILLGVLVLIILIIRMMYFK